MIIQLFPDVYARAPELCEKCEKNPVEFGSYCLACYEALQRDITDAWYEDQQYYKGDGK